MENNMNNSLEMAASTEILDCLIEARGALTRLSHRLDGHLATGRTPVAHDISEHVAELHDLLADISTSLLRVQVGAKGGARVAL
jgi:hypothetical protein